MAETTYTYSIQSDFPNHLVCSDRLTQEVGVSAIIVALSRIDTAAGNCLIVFKDALSSGDEDILDGLVAAHSGEAIIHPATVLLGSPETSDGKPIFLPCLFPGNVFLFICGASDSETVRGEGGLFIVESDVAGDTVVEMDPFLDYIYIAGGQLVFSGGQLGDWFSGRMVCPATVVTPNGSNTGNCNIMPCPPCPGLPPDINLIMPANGNGTHDVDLTTASLVPSHDTEETGAGTGFYNWNEPTSGTGRGTISAVPNMTGDYHLVDKEVQLVAFVNKVSLLGSGLYNITLPAVKPKKILPHWHGRMTLHNTGHTGLKAGLTMVTARRVTV